MPPSPHNRAHLLGRLAASLLGSYAFVWGLVSLLCALALALGVPYDDALQLASWLGLLAFVAAVCVAFVVRRLALVWSWLAGGGAMMTCAAWLVLRALR